MFSAVSDVGANCRIELDASEDSESIFWEARDDNFLILSRNSNSPMREKVDTNLQDLHEFTLK